MSLPAEYLALKTLHQKFIAMGENTRSSINQIDQLLNQARDLINTLAREHPAEETIKAQTSALTLLEKAQKQAESYPFIPEPTPPEADGNPFIDVLQPAQEALDLFLHTAFPEQQP
jgi:hypothetical protein